MELTINGKNESLDGEGITVARLLAIKEVDSPDMVSVQLNGRILDRGLFEAQELTAGDEIEFLYFMGGGSR